MPRALGVASLAVILATQFFALYPEDWLLENLAVALVCAALAWNHRRLPLSNTSYFMLFAMLCAHEYGAMYSYSNTPLGHWAAEEWGFARNHYDRVVHFLSGVLFLLPGYELFARWTGRGGWVPLVLSAQAIVAAGAVYEVVEWLVAMAVAPDLGLEFVGAQGDGWDAAKDLACALAGCVVAAPALLAGSIRWRRVPGPGL